MAKPRKGCTRRSDTLMEIRKKVTSDPELFPVAEVNGAIVGSVVVGFDGWRGLIYHLAVATPFRSQSLGLRLMNEVETGLQAKGCLKCYLMVTVDNPEAGKYYEQRAWYETDTVRLYGKDLQ